MSADLYRRVTQQLVASEIDERIGDLDVPLHLEHTAMPDASDDEFDTQSISLVFLEPGGEENGDYIWRARRHNTTTEVFLSLHPDGSATPRFPIPETAKA
jgi:hypothetical protein